MKFTVYSALIFAALLFTTTTSYAESYRWVDEYGKVRIGIKPVAEPVEMDEGDDEEEAAEEASVTPTPVPANVIKARPPVAAPQIVAPTPAPASVISAPVAAPKIAAPVKAPTANKAPHVEHKPSVKKPAIVKQKPPAKKPVVKKAPAKKPVIKKAVAKKKPKPAAKPKKVAKPKKAVPEKAKATAAKADSKRNEEMCGVFTAYVHDYEDKVSTCSKNLCAIYQRSLDRYKKKQKSYCG